MSAEDLLARLRELAQTAESERHEERVFATTNSVAHYVCGAAGVVGGAVAAATASSEPTWIPVAAGISAAIGSGLATIFKFEEKGRRRFGQERRYKSFIEHAENEYARLAALNGSPAEVGAALADLQSRLDKVRGASEG